jgi:hypothetical protein
MKGFTPAEIFCDDEGQMHPDLAKELGNWTIVPDEDGNVKLYLKSEESK